MCSDDWHDGTCTACGEAGPMRWGAESLCADRDACAALLAEQYAALAQLTYADEPS